MVSLYQFTFQNVNDNHTIYAEFEEEITPPTPVPVNSGSRIYIKENGQWIPLFTENEGE